MKMNRKPIWFTLLLQFAVTHHLANANFTVSMATQVTSLLVSSSAASSNMSLPAASPTLSLAVTITSSAAAILETKSNVTVATAVNTSPSATISGMQSNSSVATAVTTSLTSISKAPSSISSSTASSATSPKVTVILPNATISETQSSAAQVAPALTSTLGIQSSMSSSKASSTPSPPVNVTSSAAATSSIPSSASVTPAVTATPKVQSSMSSSTASSTPSPSVTVILPVTATFTPAVTSTLKVQNSMSSPTSSSTPSPSVTIISSAAATSRMQSSTPAVTSISKIQSSMSSSTASQSSVVTGPPVIIPITTANAKKFKVSFKLTNLPCSDGIKENDVKSQEYKDLSKKLLDAIKNAFVNDAQYRGSRIIRFECGSVIPIVEITKSENATSNANLELKVIESVVSSGTFAGYSTDTTSFSSSPQTYVAPAPKIYVNMKTDLSVKLFCNSLNNFKRSIAQFLVTSNGFEFIKASQVVVYDNQCNVATLYYANSNPSFYISVSATDASQADIEMTTRIYRLIKQFNEEGTTWRLGAALDGKIKKVDLAGTDKKEETDLSELTIVLIGMGSTFGLLLLIITIILIVGRMRRSHEDIGLDAVTIQNNAYGEKKRAQYGSVNEGYERKDEQLVVDGNDYEYPDAPSTPATNGYHKEESTVISNKAAYQELQPAEKTPPSNYETLSAEEEATTKVAVDPQSSGYTEITPPFKPELKQLTQDELAQRKDDGDRLRKEFEGLEFDMPAGSLIYPSGTSEKNRLVNVIPSDVSNQRSMLNEATPLLKNSQ